MPHFCGRTHARRDRRDYELSDNGHVEQRAHPTPQQVADLAYSYWMARGCPAGSPWEDWFRAEQDLKNRA